MSIALVTDSTATLLAEAHEHGIEVVPLHVVIDGQDFSEGEDLSGREVAEALRSRKRVSTSRPTPQAFLAAYERAAKAGATEIVSVHLSSDLSSTVGSAHLAAHSASVPVSVLDSRVMGMAMGFPVLSGAALAAGGASVIDVERHILERARNASCLVYVDTLEHLRRGGRIGRANALLGSTLAIKPLLAVRDGHIVPLEKVRTASRAIARLEELASEQVASAPRGADVAVHHLDAAERAEALADRLATRIGSAARVTVRDVGAVVGAHVGPGTLAVVVVPHASSL